MAEQKSQNDQAWELLFEKYDIMNQIDMNGVFKISADQIREFREPRLMAKFDHTINLPKLFAKNGLAILPITRGDYIISHFDAYHKFEDDIDDVERVSLPSYIQSLDCSDISSEAIALNCAIASGIIEDFAEDEQMIPTVSGRMGSGLFGFKIYDTFHKKHRDVNVINSQIEIDAAYEGLKCLALFEAKRDLSEDFLVRQLYYPFRTWNAKVDKEVKPIFLVYSNGIYKLYQYKFENPFDYSSLVLVKQKNYSVEDTLITSEDIQDVLYRSVYCDEPEISFPQADTFERVINLCELLSSGPMKKDKITDEYAFDARQTDYYTNAARYLDLVEKRTEDGSPVYSLSSKGERILKKNYKQRQLSFCTLVLQHKAFAEVLKMYFNTGYMPPNNEIAEVMKGSNLYNVGSESTFLRRASTIRGWLEWIVGLINE